MSSLSRGGGLLTALATGERLRSHGISRRCPSSKPPYQEQRGPPRPDMSESVCWPASFLLLLRRTATTEGVDQIGKNVTSLRAPLHRQLKTATQDAADEPSLGSGSLSASLLRGASMRNHQISCFSATMDEELLSVTSVCLCLSLTLSHSLSPPSSSLLAVHCDNVMT